MVDRVGETGRSEAPATDVGSQPDVKCGPRIPPQLINRAFFWGEWGTQSLLGGFPRKMVDGRNPAPTYEALE